MQAVRPNLQGLWIWEISKTERCRDTEEEEEEEEFMRRLVIIMWVTKTKFEMNNNDVDG